MQVMLKPEQTKGFVLLKKRWVVERTFGWLMGSRQLVRLRVIAHNIRDADLPCHDSIDGTALGIKAYISHLLK
jgi:transposase